MANRHLHIELYKAIVALKSSLEADWVKGLRGNGYYFPTMAAGYEFQESFKVKNSNNQIGW